MIGRYEFILDSWIIINERSVIMVNGRTTTMIEKYYLVDRHLR
ncbi:hypothetical protein [Flavobacterium oreochromis]|uniref:Uncharacterized protein n=1 Tax=Flavobacterium oreochromis TaxID=2906078 RepID=A0ABW8PB31_9FLAO|nr:hypothetical protein [Flavobacterium oreochromis]